MKINIDPPPVRDGNTEEKLRALLSWLYKLTETLNVAFESLGMENLNSETKAKIESGE